MTIDEVIEALEAATKEYVNFKNACKGTPWDKIPAKNDCLRVGNVTIEISEIRELKR